MRALSEALARERAALLARDAAAIEAAAHDKQVLLEQLRILAPDGARPGDLPARNDELARLAEHCRRENRVNGVLLEAQRHQTERLLAIVTGRAPETRVTYGPRGEQPSRIGGQIKTTA